MGSVNGNDDIQDDVIPEFTYHTSSGEHWHQYVPLVTTQWGSEGLYAKYGGSDVDECSSVAFGGVKTDLINGSCPVALSATIGCYTADDLT